MESSSSSSPKLDNIEAWLYDMRYSVENEQKLDENDDSYLNEQYRKRITTSNENHYANISPVVVRKQNNKKASIERKCIYIENPNFSYLNLETMHSSNDLSLVANDRPVTTNNWNIHEEHRISYPFTTKVELYCNDRQSCPPLIQNRKIDQIFDSEYQCERPTPPVRKRKQNKSIQEESIYENIWELGVANSTVQYEQFENDSDTSSLISFYEHDLPPPDYDKVIEMDRNKRQGIDFEYLEYTNPREIDFDFHTSSSSSSSSSSSVSNEVIYENISNNRVSIKKYLCQSAPNLTTIVSATTALPLCAAEEVYYTYESTNPIRESTLLTGSKLDLLSDYVTVRKNSITSDIVEWSYQLYQNSFTEIEVSVMEEKSLLDIDSQTRSKSASASPVSIRKSNSCLESKSRHHSLVEDQKSLENTNVKQNLVSDSTLIIVKEGVIDRSKLVDINKKPKKWISNSYGCLTRNTFYLFESKQIFDAMKAGAKSKRNYDIKINLQKCEMQTKSEYTNRKNIIALIDIVNGAQILLQFENRLASEDWQHIISDVLMHFVTIQSPLNVVVQSKSKTSITLQSSNETLAATKESKRIGNKFKHFFSGRNQSIEDLCKEKDLPVFGNDLDNLCAKLDRPKVPLFVQKCIEAIEPYLNTEGIYRASGNLSLIQKIRFEVDQNQYDNVNGDKVDVHVLTGALKMFFRELKVSVIPANEYDNIIAASNNPNTLELICQIKIVLNRLSESHRDTLQFLMKHLLKVSMYATENRMDVANLATVWAPNLIQQFTAADISNNSKITKDTTNVCPFLECTFQMKLIRILLTNFNDIFTES